MARQRLVASPIPVTTPYGEMRHARCKVSAPFPIDPSHEPITLSHCQPAHNPIVDGAGPLAWVGLVECRLFASASMSYPLSPSASAGPPIEYTHPPSTFMLLASGQAGRHAGWQEKHATAARAKKNFLLVIESDRGARGGHKHDGPADPSTCCCGGRIKPAAHGGDAVEPEERPLRKRAWPTTSAAVPDLPQVAPAAASPAPAGTVSESPHA